MEDSNPRCLPAMLSAQSPCDSRREAPLGKLKRPGSGLPMHLADFVGKVLNGHDCIPSEIKKSGTDPRYTGIRDSGINMASNPTRRWLASGGKDALQKNRGSLHPSRLAAPAAIVEVSPLSRAR